MSVNGKLPWDAECDATRAGMERFMRALVCTRSHFTDSLSLAPVDKPARGVSVFLRVWITEGAEQRFMDIAGIDELKPPPRVQLGMDYTTPDDGRRRITRDRTAKAAP